MRWSCASSNAWRFLDWAYFVSGSLFSWSLRPRTAGCPGFWLLSITYGIAAYIVLPRAIRLGLKILQHKRVPSYTITGDGLPGDPVNVALVGTLQQLRSAFRFARLVRSRSAGAGKLLGHDSGLCVQLALSHRPFSTLYLFGRGQDIGFQKAIDNSPRKRHHIRFWALSVTRAQGYVGCSGLLAQHRPATGQ